MDEIKNIINEIMDDIRKRRESIKEIPGIPERCINCFDGEFLIQNLPFTCEFFSEFSCPIFKEEIKENIGKIFLNTSIDKVEESVRAILLSYLSNIKKMVREGRGLNILGPIGVGKTSIIVLIIQKIFKERYSFRYFHIKSFLDSQIENINFNAFSFLFIDDLGSEYLNEKNSSFINYVIDLRYRFMLPTIITSNLSERDLRGRYPRAMDRLFNRNIKINLEGASRRSRIKND